MAKPVVEVHNLTKKFGEFVTVDIVIVVTLLALTSFSVFCFKRIES